MAGKGKVRAKVRHVDIDRGWAEMLKAAKAIHGGAHVKVGYLGARAAKAEHVTEKGEPLTNAQLGLIHEFGTARTPERSHLRHTFDKFRTEYEQLAAKLCNAVLTSQMPWRKALALLGTKHAADIKAEISGGFIRQELAPSTLARKLAKTRPGAKGDPKALIETARLMNSISYAVEQRGAGGGE
jgi:hypothetical protein